MHISLLDGAEVTRKVALAVFVLNIWDILISLDEEVKHFWSGPWGISRILFLFNRYLAPIVSILVVYSLFGQDLTPTFCERVVKAGYALNVIGLTAIQAVLVFRIWHLFRHSKTIRGLTVSSFILATILSSIFVSKSTQEVRAFQLPVDIPNSHLVGCPVSSPSSLWHMLVPSLVLHTLLFILTTLRAYRIPTVFKDAPLMRRILRDGGIFYVVVFMAVGLTAIAAFLTKIPQVNTPALFSNFMFAVCSVAVSRLMLSIKSLASHLGYDEKWILGNVELSRVSWKKGSREGEIIVELGYDKDDSSRSDAIDIGLIGSFATRNGRDRHNVGVRVTRVGMVDEPSAWY